MKKTLSLILALSMLLFAGCGAATEGNGSAISSDSSGMPASSGETIETTPASDFKAGIIFTEAGLGGQSFNDLAFEGVQRAEQELGIKFDYVEPKSVSDEEIVQDEMAASGEYGIIICVGAEQVDALNRVAVNYPDQKFALIDATLDLPNVASYIGKEEEGSFLAGALAVLVKQEKLSDKVGDSKTIGIIGGVDNPLINRFSAGFAAGAKTIDPEYNVLVDYVGGFSDPTTAKNIANTFYSKGADVIYHASGASGMGLFQAATENNILAIGVNLNQNSVAPDNIIASMMKRVDSSAYHAIESAMNGTFESGVKTMGLADEGVGLNFEGSNVEISEQLHQELDSLKERIVSGELVVPDTLDKVDAFIEAQK